MDYVAKIPVLGEQEAQILLSMNIETGERIVRVQLGDSNALRYTVLDGLYEFAIKYLGVRRAYFSLYKDDNDVLNGHIYEYLVVNDITIKSAADFYISEDYLSVVGNKSSGLIGFDGYITELYDVSNGKLIAYEVMKTKSVSAVNVTFNTLWFDLHDVDGITSIKFIEGATSEDEDYFYVNNSNKAWKAKDVGVLGGLKTLSRRFDIEFRTQYFYQYDQEKEEYVSVAVKVPMLFVQEEYYDDAIKDIKNTNNIEVSFNVDGKSLDFLMSEYDTKIEIFIENKEVVTTDIIIAFIGNPIKFE